MFNSNMLTGVIVLIVFALIMSLVFLVCREIITWYWKINRAIELLERIEHNTRGAGEGGD